MRLLVLAVTLVACGVPGIPLVEDAILCCLGILLRYGYFDVLALPVAFVGLIAGDLVTYSFGARYGSRLLDRVPESVDRWISLWFLRWGAWTVAALRVGPGLRMPGFLLAGATRMSLRRFLVADIAGALVSLPLFVGLGWVLAGAFDRVERALLVIGGVAAVVLLFAGLIFTRCVRTGQGDL